jgi:hypothetical protein
MALSISVPIKASLPSYIREYTDSSAEFLVLDTEYAKHIPAIHAFINENNEFHLNTPTASLNYTKALGAEMIINHYIAFMEKAEPINSLDILIEDLIREQGFVVLVDRLHHPYVLVKDNKSFEAFEAWLAQASEGEGSYEYWNNLGSLADKGHCIVCFFPPGECDHPPACDGCMWHMAFPDLDDCICSMLVENGHCPMCISPPGGEHARDCNDYEPSEEEEKYPDEKVNYDYRDPGGIWH